MTSTQYKIEELLLSGELESIELAQLIALSQGIDMDATLEPLREVTKILGIPQKGFDNQLHQIIARLKTIKEIGTHNIKLRKLVGYVRFLRHIPRLIVRGIRSNDFPHELLAFDHIQELTISGVQIKEIPEEIGKLQHLHTLTIKLSQNIEHLERLALLPNLRNLNIYCDELEAFPEGLCTLKNLQHLTVSSPKLTTLPDQFSNLQQLQSLRLSSEKLRRLPEEIYKLSNLETLTVDVNRRRMLRGICHLKNLRKLHLSLAPHLFYPSKIPLAIQNLKNLEYLTIAPFQRPAIFTAQDAERWASYKRSLQEWLPQAKQLDISTYVLESEYTETQIARRRRRNNMLSMTLLIGLVVLLAFLLFRLKKVLLFIATSKVLLIGLGAYFLYTRVLWRLVWRNR